MGYYLKLGFIVYVKIDGREYLMFGKGKRVWICKEWEELFMIVLMKVGVEMLVEVRLV